eukprot:6208794-Ditylum_brightwellii.AAC.1
MSLASFLSSASYLERGISLLCDDHWEEYYDLSLHIYSLYAEVEYCNGGFNNISLTVKTIFAHAKTYRGKLRAYATLIKALVAQHKLLNATDMGFGVLTQLGVQSQPSPPDTSA